MSDSRSHTPNRRITAVELLRAALEQVDMEIDESTKVALLTIATKPGGASPRIRDLVKRVVP
jgi:hypothetical protein